MSRTSSYTIEIVAPKLETRMVVTVEPPTSAVAGEPFTFAGYLEDVDGNRLGGKTINLVGTAMTTTTNASGEWGFSVVGGSPGTITIYAEFPGDADYLGCSEVF